MTFTLSIEKKRNDRACRTVDLRSSLPGEPSEHRLFAYNDILSRLVHDHAQDLRYILSPTLTRIEGQTGCYDKLARYLFAAAQMENSDDNLSILTRDLLLLCALHRYARIRRIPHRYPLMRMAAMLFFRRFLFVLRLAWNMIREAGYIALAHMLLSAIRRQAYDYLVLSFYDHRSVRKAAYHDPYFAPVIDMLSREGKPALVIASLLNKNNPSRILSYMRQIRRFSSLPEVTTPYRLLSFKDLFPVFEEGMKTRITFTAPVLFEGLDITPLLNLSLQQDFETQTWLYPLMQRALFVKVLTTVSCARVLYPYENHPWEKLLVRTRDELSTETYLCAFQHTSLSLKLLNYFPGEHEKDLPVYPDRILTVGPIIKRVLEHYGRYPEGLIAEGCALRHPYLFDARIPPPKKNRSFALAYAFSFDRSTYDTIIDNLITLFKDTPYTVYLKLHPLTAHTYRRKGPLPRTIIIAHDRPWSELFGQIDLLLYDDNSLGIEALRYGVEPVYFPFTGQVYNTDRLFFYEGKRAMSATLAAFAKMIAGFYAGTQTDSGRSQEEAYNAQYLSSYFAPITPERVRAYLE